MQNAGKMDKLNTLLRVLISSLVILFGLCIMIMPILKSISLSSGSTRDSISGFVLGILIILFLPSIFYCTIAMITKEMEYIIIPALFLLAAEYYFFRDFLTWISSDANAAIGLVIIPFYLFLISGFSYGVAYIIIKVRKHKNRHI